jgi:hypothetical protein
MGGITVLRDSMSAGQSPSAFFQLEINDPSVYAGAAATLAAADAVQVFEGSPPTIPIRDDATMVQLGRYGGPLPDGTPLAILINPQTSDPALSTAHELGHYVDHQVLGGGGHLASQQNQLPAWWAAVQASSTIQGMTAAYNLTHLAILGYLLRPEELFARSYAQWLALRSRAAALVADLQAAQGLAYGEQWPDNDFIAIAQEMDQVLT